jgi:hypothetical protein
VEYSISDIHQSLQGGTAPNNQIINKQSTNTVIIKEGQRQINEQWCRVLFSEYIKNISRDRIMKFVVWNQTNPPRNFQLQPIEHHLSWSIRKFAGDHSRLLYGHCKWQLNTTDHKQPNFVD